MKTLAACQSPTPPRTRPHPGGPEKAQEHLVWYQPIPRIRVTNWRRTTSRLSGSWTTPVASAARRVCLRAGKRTAEAGVSRCSSVGILRMRRCPPSLAQPLEKETISLSQTSKSFSRISMRLASPALRLAPSSTQEKRFLVRRGGRAIRPTTKPESPHTALAQAGIPTSCRAPACLAIHPGQAFPRTHTPPELSPGSTASMGLSDCSTVAASAIFQDTAGSPTSSAKVFKVASSGLLRGITCRFGMSLVAFGTIKARRYHSMKP
eukprot:Rmarinus@m.10676